MAKYEVKFEVGSSEWLESIRFGDGVTVHNFRACVSVLLTNDVDNDEVDVTTFAVPGCVIEHDNGRVYTPDVASLTDHAFSAIDDGLAMFWHSRIDCFETIHHTMATRLLEKRKAGI